VADHSSGEVQKDLLQVDDRAIFRGLKELCRSVFVDFRQHVFDQDVEIGSAEELQAGLALSLPQVAGGVDDAIALSESVCLSPGKQGQWSHIRQGERLDEEVCAWRPREV
jgi:hypothetical protein